MIYEYKGGKYPEYLRQGDACRHIAATAAHFCRGRGLDVGAGKWPLPGAIPVDTVRGGDAMNLPAGQFNYVFSSHCLEHLPNPVAAIEHWKTRLAPGGVLFLYLPHPDMEYWLPQNCRKHLHSWRPHEVARMLRDLGFINVIHSERDLAWSFAVVGFIPGGAGIDAPDQFRRMVEDGEKFFSGDTQMLAIWRRFGSDAFRRSSLLDGLDDAMRHWGIRGRRAVEIGTFNGVTAIILARYFDEVVTIDVLPDTIKHAILETAGVANVRLVDVADNAEKARVLSDLDFDFAYQDGDHANDTLTDFELLRRCGRVVLHEYWEQQKPVWDMVNSLRSQGHIEVRGKLAYWRAV